jgi:hypothetical protein
VFGMAGGMILLGVPPFLPISPRTGWYRNH